MFALGTSYKHKASRVGTYHSRQTQTPNDEESRDAERASRI